jgi:hypothetical protein
MSFTLNRNINNKAIKKNVTISNTINSNSLKASIGTTGSAEFIILDTLNLNNVLITASANQLNYLQVTAGNAEASKALVLNSSRDISNIGTITCTTNITVNGTSISSNNDISGGSSDDSNNPYLTGITTGIGKASKALITNNNSNISNINELSLNSLKIKDSNLEFNDINKIYHIDNIKKKSYSTINNIEKLLTNFSTVSINQTYFNSGNWTSICWSPQLEIFVAAASSNSSDNTANKIMVSNNGFNWTPYPDPYIGNSYNCICWSPELSLFIAVGSTIIRSTNGIDWIGCYMEYAISLNSVCWSPELNLFVAVGNSGTANRILKSSDGINWTAATGGSYSLDLVSVCWANKLNLFVAVASGGENIYRIMISNNGNNWEVIKHPNFNNTVYYNVIWSEELNLLLATTATFSRIIRSRDGINWESCFSYENSSSQWNWYQIRTIIWIKDLHVFVAAMHDRPNMYLSYDGIRWRDISVNSHQYRDVAWSPSVGLVFVSTSTTKVIVSSLVKTQKSPIINNFNSISINNNNNYVGINTLTPNKPLEINSPTGNCLKILSNPISFWNNFATFDVANNGIFNITSSNTNNDPLNVNFTTDFRSYGLKLNNVLLTPSITDYTYLSNITPGIASNSKALILDNNLDIANINVLSCTTLNVNGTSINDTNNNIYLSNLEVGNGTPSKGLITNSTNDINNINQIATNSYTIQYDNIYGSNLTDNINIINLNNKYNLHKKSITVNTITSSNWNITNITNVNWSDICYSPELNLFVVIGHSTIITSTDGKVWTNVDISYNVSLSRICWSSELGKFIIVVNGNTDFSILVSDNGFQWYNSNLFIEINSQVDIIWAKELRSFIIVNATYSPRCHISTNGLNWTSGTISNSYAWSSVCWCNKWGLLVACANNNSVIGTSKDGIIWNYIQIKDSSTQGYNSIAWSQELNMAIAVSSAYMTYSYDGINWYVARYPFSANQIVWCNSLNVFITCAGYNNLMYSSNGFNWLPIPQPNSNNWHRFKWIDELSMIVLINNSSNERIATLTIPGLTNNRSNIISHKSQVYMDKINGRLGIGTEVPNYQLELSTDSAGKPSSNTWTVASDSRLKENIENADLNLCYDIIKNLKLKKYKWKDNIFDKYQIKDRSKLGWIADEVEQIFPKAVDIKNVYGLDNCKVLNIDQIITAMYGFSQKLINNYENIDEDINDISIKLNTIDEFIKKLEL